jgi:two-component system response regulator HydG
MSQETMMRLTHYDWPGNIRELECVMERAVLFCKGEELTVGSLPDELQDFVMTGYRVFVPHPLPMEEIEREVIMQTLERTSGNVKRTAEILCFPRPTFYRKLKKLGIKVERNCAKFKHYR